MRTASPKVLLPLLCFVLIVAGCNGSGNRFDSLTAFLDESIVGGIPIDHTDPEGVVEAHARALSEKSLAAYLALLEPDFRFYIYDVDAIDFPWLTEDYWLREVEAEMIGNMMDPDFSGDEPPVESIVAAFRVLHVGEQDGGVIEVTADAILEALIGPNDGWSSDTRFVMKLAPDSDGFLRIRSMWEIEKLSPRGSNEAIESQTWGRIKAQFR
jgi:hypothetical protein